MKHQVLILAVAAMLLIQAFRHPNPGDAGSPPNIVIIFTDDQGYADAGCFGATEFETPNIDRMAREGLRLTQFYTAQPVCSASRAALLTGCYSNRVGIHEALMPNAATGLHPDETTIADMLKKRGYRTAAFGKWHLGDHPRFMPGNQGFDEFFGIPYSGDMWPYHPQQGTVFNFGPLPLWDGEKIVDTLHDQSLLTTQITERSVDFIRRNRDQPFFLYVPHPQPHVPLFVSEKFRGKSQQGRYGDVIMELDWSVGQILQALRENGIDERTMVIFTSDNGPWLAYGNHAGSAAPLREGKGTVWEGGVREPCILRYPGLIPAGRSLDIPLMTIDLLPTLAALTGAELPTQKIDGRNALPLLRGESQTPPHDYLFFYYNRNELHAVRHREWKLYFPHTYRSMGDNPPGKNGLPGTYSHNTINSPELYNLLEDPSEKQDRARDFPNLVASISARADSMRLELGDRLMGLEGRENRPPGRVD